MAPRSEEAGPSKSEQVHEIIRARIVAGTYAPGDRLVISSLARKLGVSPLPVREAIRQLEAEGLIVFERNVGARVVSLNVTEWEATMHMLALLEGYATTVAAPLMRQADLDQARSVNEEMRRAVLQDGDPLRIGKINRTFHFVVYSRCPNEYLRDVIRRAWDRLDAMRTTIFIHVPGRARDSVCEHEELLRMIESEAAPEELERAAREHKLRTVAAFLEGTPARAPAARPDS